MKEFDKEAVDEALRTICIATGNAPFILAFCMEGDQMHMLSNMYPDGVNQLLKNCQRQAEELVGKKDNANPAPI